MRMLLAILALCFATTPLLAHEQAASADDLVDQVINAVGGREKVLNIFRFRERIRVTSTPTPLAKDDEGNRTSIVQAGGDWWMGPQNKKRDKETVLVLCHAWSLRILLNTESKIDTLPEIAINGKPAVGLRVTGSVKKPVDLYFDSESKRLVAIDYTSTRHLFSQWKSTTEGHVYPAHVEGYRFADRKKRIPKKEQWYQTDIIELVPLKKLPEGLN